MSHTFEKYCPAMCIITKNSLRHYLMGILIIPDKGKSLTAQRVQTHIENLVTFTIYLPFNVIL